MPRYIYKLSSDVFRKAGWNYRYDKNICEGIIAKEIIPLSSSQVIRFIDEIKGRGDVDERARAIRKEMREVGREAAKGYKARIRKLYQEFYSLQIIPEYLCIVIKSKADYARLNKGFSFNGMKYRRMVSTSNGLKERSIIYTSEDIYDELMERLLCGRHPEVKYIPAKAESYRSLVCSTSVPVSWPRGVVVVRDAVTYFKEDAILLSDNESGRPDLVHEKDYEVELDASDGYGLATPELMERWRQDINEDKPLTGVCLRNAFCKGMIYPFDFRQFAKSVARTSEITDIWGQIHKIQDVELILTGSMLKFWKAYSSIDEYLDNCHKYHYTFAITKSYTADIENERDLNYQFIQTLNIDDKGIDQILSPAVHDIADICGGDTMKMLIYLCGRGLNEENYFIGKEPWLRALILKPDMINDKYIANKIHHMLNKRITGLKFGRVPIHGNFQVLSGDPYALCESMFGLEIKGLLGRGEYYSSYWKGQGVHEVAVFRAPMSCKNNIVKGQISYLPSAAYWYRYMSNVFILNAWDSTMAALNGCDFDGDICFSTDHPVILGGVEDTETVFCQQHTADKEVVTEKNVIESNIHAFGNHIGQITNRITAMIDLQAGFPRDSLEYKELEYRIICGQSFQQAEIDKFKGISVTPMPKSWYLLKYCETDAEKRICASRRPRFMTYTRIEYASTLKKYETVRNASCERLFGKPVSDLENDGEEGEFLRSYWEHYPVLDGNGVMNRLCRRAEYLVKNIDVSIRGRQSFDYSVFKSDIPYSKQISDKVRQLYDEYVESQTSISRSSNYTDDERGVVLAALLDVYKSQMLSVVPDEDVLCEILIDIASTSEKAKGIVWAIVGDEIVLKIMSIVNSVRIPVLDPHGEIEFQGEQYTVKEVRLDYDSCDNE